MNSHPHFGHNALAQPPQGPLAKLLAFVLSAAFLILAFMFSLVALAVVAVAGLAVGGWLWWRTRQLRREIKWARDSQRQSDAGTSTNGPAYKPSAAPHRSTTVIEGEAVRMPDEAAGTPSQRLG